jgi:hypothetical protein
MQQFEKHRSVGGFDLLHANQWYLLPVRHGSIIEREEAGNSKKHSQNSERNLNPHNYIRLMSH